MRSDRAKTGESTPRFRGLKLEGEGATVAGGEPSVPNRLELLEVVGPEFDGPQPEARVHPALIDTSQAAEPGEEIWCDCGQTATLLHPLASNTLECIKVGFAELNFGGPGAAAHPVITDFTQLAGHVDELDFGEARAVAEKISANGLEFGLDSPTTNQDLVDPFQVATDAICWVQPSFGQPTFLGPQAVPTEHSGKHGRVEAGPSLQVAPPAS